MLWLLLETLNTKKFSCLNQIDLLRCTSIVWAMPLHQKPFSLNSLNKSKPQTFCSREKHSAPAAQNTGEMTYSDIERNVTTNIRSLFVNYQINAGICHSIKSIFVDVDKHTHTKLWIPLELKPKTSFWWYWLKGTLWHGFISLFWPQQFTS